MAFLNSALLIGLVAVAVPVILHFLLRQKPKRLLFPALQLIEQRRKQNVRRLKLRHFWLMLLRMLVFAGIVLAVARPALPPANYGLTLFELSVLLGVLAAGVGIYYWQLQRARNQLAATQFEERRSTLRGWTTGGTLLSLLLLVGCPYQQRIAGEITNPNPGVPLDVPVAGVLIFDTSLSMGYQQEGKTHLDRARIIAENHLRELPNGSRVAIADTSADHPITYQSTLQAAQSRLKGLAVQPGAGTLDERIRDAIRAQQDDRRRTLEELGAVAEDSRKDRYVRRVYLFTDLSAASWRLNAAARLQADLEQMPGLNLYLIDVGQEEPRNVAITDIVLSRERIAQGGDLIVSAVVEGTGLDTGEQTLELLLNSANGQPAKHGQVNVRLEPGTPVRAEFPVLTGVTGPLLQGTVRLAGTDPLEFDNTRYFSAAVTVPPQVLVVASELKDTNELVTALAPYEGREAGRNRFQPVTLNAAQLRETDLTPYAAVCLVNVTRLPDDAWFRLGQYVDAGGGLGVFLGSDQISPVAYNRAQAQAFLPAALDVYEPERDWRILINDRQHPLFWKFRQNESYGAFSIFENEVWVSRFWRVNPAEGATVLATYTDDKRAPALVERPFGRGRTVLWTTAVNLPDNYRQRWTNLPSPLLEPWLFVAFVEQLVEYTTRFTDRQHNYLAGQSPQIPITPLPVDGQFLLREPQFKQRPVKVPAQEIRLTLPPTVELGHYELVSTAGAAPLAGYSVNSAASESNLTRLTQQQLDDLLGKERYQLAQNIEELQDRISAADLGQEVYSVVLLLLLLAFIGEHLLANWFYETPQRDEAWSPPAKVPQPA